MTKKKVSKKKVVKKVKTKEVETKYLEQVDLLEIELSTKELRLKELEVLAMSQKKKIIDLEFENERLKKHNEYSGAKDKKESVLKRISKKHGFDSNIKSFDPVSGEIKE